MTDQQVRKQLVIYGVAIGFERDLSVHLLSFTARKDLEILRQGVEGLARGWKKYNYLDTHLVPLRSTSSPCDSRKF